MKKIIKDKAAVITGSGRGIGKALAVGFAKLGANVVLTARTDEEIKSVKDLVEAEGQKALAVPANVQDYEAIKNVIDKGIAEFGKIDALINNAGYSRLKPIHKMRVQEFQDIIKTNVLGVYNATHAIAPHMIENKSGSIVNTGSLTVNLPLAGWSAYAMTKGALLTFTTHLAEEMKRNKIRVNTVMPNMVHTPLLHSGMSEERIKTLDAMQPKELVPYYAFLCSDKAKRITGQNISVDVMEKIVALKSELPEEEKENPSWGSVAGLVKKKMRRDDYKMARKCKKLVAYLLKVK